MVRIATKNVTATVPYLRTHIECRFHEDRAGTGYLHTYTPTHLHTLLHPPIHPSTHRSIRFFALLLAALTSLLAPLACRGQDVPNSLSFVVYGNAGGDHEVHRQLIALLMAFKPDLILQTGDLVARGNDAEEWLDYDILTGEMRKQIPVYPTRGLHDLGGPGYDERITFPIPSGTKHYYSFDRANCHFICLDSFDPCFRGTAQYNWLRTDLAGAHARHTFVFFENPLYTPTGHDDKTQQLLLGSLFEYGKVQVVFNGREPIYYRTRRNGVVYVVTGGGGARLHPIIPGKDVLKTDKWESAHHIVFCQVNGKRVTITAIRDDGTILDQFTI